MKESTFVKTGIVVVTILLVVDIGSRIFFSPLEAKAAGKVQYTIAVERVPAKFESLLNDMASQGWELDCYAEGTFIFKK